MVKNECNTTNIGVNFEINPCRHCYMHAQVQIHNNNTTMTPDRISKHGSKKTAAG